MLIGKGLTRDGGGLIRKRGTTYRAQKKIHGAAASAAERCDICEKILLPECRSWREHRPVYGPSIGISVMMSAQHGGACQNSTFELQVASRKHDGQPPRQCRLCIGEAMNATRVPIISRL